MIYKSLHLLQLMVQQIYPLGRWNLPPGINLPRLRITGLRPTWTQRLPSIIR